MMASICHILGARLEKQITKRRHRSYFKENSSLLCHPIDTIKYILLQAFNFFFFLPTYMWQVNLWYLVDWSQNVFYKLSCMLNIKKPNSLGNVVMSVLDEQRDLVFSLICDECWMIFCPPI